MSATEVSPSQSIEASLLNRHHSMSSQTSFAEADANSYISPAPPQNLPETTNHDAMDHQPSSPEPIPEQPEQASIHTDAQDHDRMAMDVDPAPPDPASAPANPSPPSPPNPQQGPQPTPNETENGTETVQSEPQVLVAVHAAADSSPSDPPPPESTDPENPSTQTTREDSAETHSEEDDNEDEAEGDDDRDESSSDEDEYWGGNRNFVANLKEDESTPSEDELKELQNCSERSASDHDYFENSVQTALDDPEYTPVDTGRISWTLSGFHGTKEAPNKQRVMHSPPVIIGGYQWRIKIYPHGNDGTDYVSVYVECSGPEGSVDPAVVNSDDSSMQGVSMEETSTDAANQSLETKDINDTAVDGTKTSIDGSWEVPAQVGCVMYNPDEPRTYAFEKSTYQFHNSSPDCGWVRFYGPWSSIHQRRHLQRQAMLRNDTLAFTAYVRVINDPTRALWFRYGDDGVWDSILKTGLRGLSAGDSAGQPVIAALAPWLHMEPFKKLILETSVPQMSKQPHKPVRPLFQALQDVLYRKHAPENHSPGYPESLSIVRKTLSLCGLDVRQSTDVVEIWETIRHSLNSEYYNETTDGTKPDVLSFIKTVRQHVRPLLPCESSESRPEPKSVQEIIDQASNDQSSYKVWDGCDFPVQNVPAVLQIELCRQKYDQTARKWKRLTHHIKMDDTIVVGAHTYTLFAMIISKGELGSGRVYPIVRAAGPISQWAKYKSHYVTYLTRRQAVDCHEGRGVSREGTESVAHIVLYIRSDVADSVLPSPEFKPTSKVMFPLERPSISHETLSPLKVIVHKASAFDSYKGVSFLDAWTIDETNSFELEFDPTSDLTDVQKKLQEIQNEAERPDQFRLWPIAANSRPVSHPNDLYLYDWPPTTKLIDCSTFFGGIRLWCHFIPLDKIDPEGGYRTVIKEVTSDPPPAPPVEEPVPPPTEEPDIPPPPPEALPAEAPTEPVAEDVVMGGTQEQPAPNSEEAVTTQGEAQPQIQETQVLENQTQEPPILDVCIKEERVPIWQFPQHVYLLIKTFDPLSQQISGYTNGFYPRDKKISELIDELDIPFKSAKALKQDTNSLVELYSTDSSLSGSSFSNGNILILVKDDLSDNDREIIRDRGDILDYLDWHSRAFSSNHFSKQASFQSGSYFGGKYVHAPLYKGRYMGESIIINTNGDAYNGNCLDGEYHGQGVMYYANGNTYTGEWASGLPEGQGTMVYNQTGNKYVGGWRAGRKHGKGVMTYEVADEEMQLCKICYENEMDALFYRCGHVAACESCARQVSDCPVCRRQVDAVVKIWRTV